MSIEGKTHLRRGRLVYRGGDSSTEGETLLRRDRLVYSGGDYSLWRRRLVYGGGNSFTEGETRQRGMLVTRCYWKCPEPVFVNRRPGIDSEGLIPPAFVAWRVGTTTLFVVPARKVRLGIGS